MSKRKTTEEFIQQGKELFGNRFDYSESVYVNAHTKIKIICRKHGLLTNLTPNKHLRRNGGCKECKSELANKRYKMTLPSFIERAEQLHGQIFDYSLVKEFKNQHEKVKIKHKDCGTVFSMSVYKHLQGQGCSKKECLAKKIARFHTKTNEEFIKEAITIHGKDHYDYSNTNYKNTKLKVNIFCNHCQKEFSITPDSHINGRSGCYECGNQLRQLGGYLFTLKKKGTYIDGVLYLLECFDDDEHFYKIGITKKSVKQRYSGITKIGYDYECIFELPVGYIRAYEYEQAVLKKLDSYRYRPKKTFGGITECLSINPLEYDLELSELLTDMNRGA